MYNEIENSIVRVVPKEALLKWILTVLDVNDSSSHLTLDVLKLDCNAYAIPEILDLEQGIEYVDDNFEKIFELELTTWSYDKSNWPELTLANFWEFFEVQTSTSLIEIVDDES